MWPDVAGCPRRRTLVVGLLPGFRPEFLRTLFIRRSAPGFFNPSLDGGLPLFKPNRCSNSSIRFSCIRALQSNEAFSVAGRDIFRATVMDNASGTAPCDVAGVPICGSAHVPKPHSISFPSRFPGGCARAGTGVDAPRRMLAAAPAYAVASPPDLMWLINFIGLSGLAVNFLPNDSLGDPGKIGRQRGVKRFELGPQQLVD